MTSSTGTASTARTSNTIKPSMPAPRPPVAAASAMAAGFARRYRSPSPIDENAKPRIARGFGLAVLRRGAYFAATTFTISRHLLL